MTDVVDGSIGDGHRARGWTARGLLQAWRGREIRHSLPVESDAFVGRAKVLAAMSRRLRAGARIVTVLGVAGSGKTRLALHYGRRRLGEFAGGVWFCDLAPARSLDGVVRAVARGLDVPLGRDDPVVQLGHAIAGRGPCLVILDHVDQVAYDAAQTVGHWLDRAGEASFVVTTREALGLPGEFVLALPPLPPVEGAALFEQRVQVVQPGLQPARQDRAAIAALVASLDGLPLAIELAAAQVRAMPPGTPWRQVAERVEALRSKGNRLDRPSTLRAAFEGSWDLLPPAEKAALAQLSVFEGGFTLAAAEAVIDLSGCAGATRIVDAVRTLVDAALLRDRGNDRFDLPVSLQRYAAEQLRTLGRYAGSGASALAAAQQRHGAYYAAFDEHGPTAAGGADLDNLVAACQRAIARGDGPTAAGTLERAWAALERRGPFLTGAELALAARAMPDQGPAAIARIERIAALALDASGQVGQAHLHLEAAFAAARDAGDPRGVAQVLAALGNMACDAGRVGEARRRLAQALTLARGAADRLLECDLLNGMGSLNHLCGHLEAARADYETALELARTVGDRRREARLLGNLGEVLLSQGRMDEARDCYEAGLAAARDVGDRRSEGNTLCNLGLLNHIQGQSARARALLGAALAMACDLGQVQLESVVHCNLGIVLESLAEPDAAVAQYEAAARVARALGDQRGEGQSLGYLGLLHARQGRHDEARRCLKWGEALLGAASDPLSLGVLLCGRAEAHHLSGETAAAAAALAEAMQIASEFGAGPGSEIDMALGRMRGLLEPARA